MAKWIMVVDDDTSNLKMAGNILSKNNMRVTALKSGRALLDYISEKGAPDLILLDIKMPEMDGFETLRRLRDYEKEHDHPETPVIFLTADENTGSETKGFEMGVSDYIRKPFNPEVLLRRIDNVISMQTEMQSLKSEATTDKLTGLLNKAATSAEFSKMCAKSTGCLMMIDLDSFKLVNDLFGHEMGDKVLIAFANLIKETVPQGSKVGRLGGDEFAAFCLGVQEESEVANITKQLNEKLVSKAKELMGEDMKIPLGTSIGAIEVPKHGNDYTSLLKLADKCLYIVKKNGKHGYSLYSSDLLKDEETDTIMDIKSISDILGERNITNVALQLDMEAFSHVFRFATRYFIRNNINCSKVLFTLSKPEDMSYEDYQDACDEFGNHIRESLRKSDMLTRSRYNQYFVLLTDIREKFVPVVAEGIIKTWDESDNPRLDIDYDSEYVRNNPGNGIEDNEAEIVIVDDDDVNLDVASGVLIHKGLTVHTYSSGEEFLKEISVAEKLPDLLLLDIKMEGMSGLEVMDKMKEMGSDLASIPVILLTGVENDGLEIEGMEKGALDFIWKPFAPELLKARVNRILELVTLRKKYHKPVKNDRT